MSRDHVTASPPREAAEGLDQGRGARIGLALLRIAIGLLWIQNSGWKSPPDFGQESETGLFKFTTYAVD